MEQRDPKHWHIKFKCQGIFKKKAHKKMLVITDTYDIPKLLKHASQILVITIQQ